MSKDLVVEHKPVDWPQQAPLQCHRECEKLGIPIGDCDCPEHPWDLRSLFGVARNHSAAKWKRRGDHHELFQIVLDFYGLRDNIVPDRSRRHLPMDPRHETQRKHPRQEGYGQVSCTWETRVDGEGVPVDVRP